LSYITRCPARYKFCHFHVLAGCLRIIRPGAPHRIRPSSISTTFPFLILDWCQSGAQGFVGPTIKGQVVHRSPFCTYFRERGVGGRFWGVRLQLGKPSPRTPHSPQHGISHQGEHTLIVQGQGPATSGNTGNLMPLVSSVDREDGAISR
jgi:hypothetical protein